MSSVNEAKMFHNALSLIVEAYGAHLSRLALEVSSLQIEKANLLRRVEEAEKVAKINAQTIEMLRTGQKILQDRIDAHGSNVVTGELPPTTSGGGEEMEPKPAPEVSENRPKRRAFSSLRHET
jgi:ribosomal protein L13